MTFDDGEPAPRGSVDPGRPVGASELRTGVIVEVPSAEALVGRYRPQLDPMARLGVPAHITVLFPFVLADDIDESVTAAVQSVAAELDRFSFELNDVGWFRDEVLWLAPTAADEFVGLTGALCDRFPAYLPYGGQFPDLIPHLTVADRAPVEAMLSAERQIRGQLPIGCKAGSLCS